MKIHDIHLYAVQGGPAPGGKRRPMAFEPYCLIEGFPAMPANLPYRVVGRDYGCRLFFREHEGSAQFFEHNPRDQAGYGGALFEGLLEDGSAFSVKGPWSSSCETVNALGLPSAPCAPVAVSPPQEYPSWRAMHVTLPILKQIADFLAPDWALVVPTPRGGEEVPWLAGASDEQLCAIGGGWQIAVPHFMPTREFEDCPDCEGRGSVGAGACDFCSGSGAWPGQPGRRCYKCQGRGFKLDPCPTCGRRGCASSIAPYPWLKM